MTLSERVYLITGGTSGIGLATAQGLAHQGATVVVVGRNPEKGARAAARLEQETGNRAVAFVQADLAAQAEIRHLAEAFEQRYGRLDVLINNVGAFFMKRRLSVDGVELTWAVNYLGIFLLTNLLLDVLRASAPARIVNVSSDAHRGAEINLADPGLERKYGPMKAYGQSKLALTLFTYELARRLDGTGVTVNAVHPGFVATDIWKGNGRVIDLLLDLVSPLFKLTAKSPEKGAETSIYLASSPEVDGLTGKYFVDKEPVKSDPASYDEVAAQRLWEISLAAVGLPTG